MRISFFLHSFHTGQRPSYNANGYGNTQRSFGGQNGGAPRQYYGDRQPRMNFNNGGVPPKTYNNFDPSAASSKIDIDSKKVGMVIGRGGGKIREIQVNFNVHVKIGEFLSSSYHYSVFFPPFQMREFLIGVC